MAIDFKDPIIITENTKLFGYNNTDINDIPTETGNFNISDVVLLTKLNLSSNLSIIKNAKNNLQYDLNIDGKKVTSFEISADRFIKSVTFDDSTKNLKFVFISSEGETPVKVDISSLIDTYTAGDGLKLVNNKFSLDLLQTLGQSTIKAMSQKSITDSIDLAKKSVINEFYNIPRITPKDITSYWNDGSLWNRIAGTNGYNKYDDIHVGDYIDMGRPVTCPNSYDGTVGSQFVTVASCGGFYGNGDTGLTYNHLIMVPGQGFDGSQHFGRHRMHSGSPTGGYIGTEMHTSVLGDVVSIGSIDSGATINQQLYYIFGSHLKTMRSLLTNAMSSSLYNRFGSAGGASSRWAWASVQSRLMSEIEVYGSTIWSSSGYDTGDANHQFELFKYSKSAINNRSAYYWLKDIASSSNFCYCSSYGLSDCSLAANDDFFVRPCFVLA